MVRGEVDERVPVEVVCEVGDAPVRPIAEGLFRRLVGRMRGKVAWTRVKLLEVRDEKGGVMKRCVVQMRLRRLPQVVFAVTHPSAREAVALAAERLKRVLARRLRQKPAVAG
ncbi:MAG: hypothetical protein N2557_01455 [Hydrogenophilus sp.]|nr:hypothetical protein [Hydrogenophilus sp.]